MLPFSGHSQTINIPRADALKVLAAADSAKIHKAVIAQLKEDLANTQAAIVQLKAALTKSETADSLSQANLKLAEEREVFLNEHIRLAESQAANWEKSYRKEKRKRVATGIAGSLGIAIAIIVPLIHK